MEYGKAFAFLTEDEKWLTKLLIGGVLVFAGGFVILPLFLVYGYSFEILQNVAAGNARPAPEWDRLEDKFKTGLYLFAIRIVYFLPFILVICCFALLAIAVSASAGSGSRDTASSLGGIIGILYFCVICFGIVYVIVATIVADAATLIYASTGQVNDAFKFGNVIALARRHAGDLIVALLLTGVAGAVGTFASLITCGLGAPFVTAWVDFAKSHLLGQIFRKSGLALPPGGPASSSPVPMTPLTPATPPM
jgi:Protein of unknown function (DUF4013)